MPTQHKSSESVRAYLLGTLQSRDASDLEMSYFTDPDRLHWIRGIEEELIEDYLRRRLSTEDTKRFEARYLNVPALRMKLEEVRARLRPAPRQSWLSMWPPLRLAVMSACVLAMAGGAWFYLRHPAVPLVSAVHAPANSPASIVPNIDIPLSPGVRMGAGAKESEVSIPPGGAKVSFTLELPGRTRPLDCSVRFLSVNPDGSRRPVWTSPALRSQATPTGGSLTVTPDSSALPPADYMIEVAATDGTVLETYVVRLNH